MDDYLVNLKNIEDYNWSAFIGMPTLYFRVINFNYKPTLRNILTIIIKQN